MGPIVPKDFDPIAEARAYEKQLDADAHRTAKQTKVEAMKARKPAHDRLTEKLMVSETAAKAQARLNKAAIAWLESSNWKTSEEQDAREDRLSGAIRAFQKATGGK